MKFKNFFLFVAIAVIKSCNGSDDNGEIIQLKKLITTNYQEFKEFADNQNQMQVSRIL